MLSRVIDSRFIMRCNNTVFFIILVSTVGITQSISNLFFQSGTSLNIDVLPENDVFYSHVYDKDVTIYSLAEIFQVSKDQLWNDSNLNPNKPINAGKIVVVNLPKERISSVKPKSDRYFILKYNVRKGRTLYSLAIAANTTVAELMKINNKSTANISENEEIIIGYYDAGKRNVSQDAASEKNIDNKKVNATEIDTSSTASSDKVTKYYVSDVIGYFQKHQGASRSAYVLHNEAKPGTFMDIYNPMFRKHTKAKVIGRIPPGTYKDDVKLIISSAVAKELGILDRRFKVNIKYEQ